ncbi:hypothetical protein MRB53_007098 [Persea americana]|uniref:Uncharacterized protein n=1 Tax=Persea americana TaxID=3435 RepID=A0ACC2MIY8_PERAE|nr:hypothetical protein MRB53_007098 [Persea americana]
MCTCASLLSEIFSSLLQLQLQEMLHLQEGALLEGTVCKIFPFGAQVRIGETNRSGLLHMSNITRSRVSSVGDLLAVDEKVKVLVVQSKFPDKISLSIADLESEPGLFLSNKEKVLSEAEDMAKSKQSCIDASPLLKGRERGSYKEIFSQSNGTEKIIHKN